MGKKRGMGKSKKIELISIDLGIFVNENFINGEGINNFILKVGVKSTNR